MKKIFRGVLLPLALILFVFFTGCPEPGTSDTINQYYNKGVDMSAALVGSVWAGQTPRAGDWATISFRPDNLVVMSFSIDNSSNGWEYTFNSLNQGTITNPSGWAPAPNGFTITGDTLTIVNYGSHEGAPRNFRRVRDTELVITQPAPFMLGTLADDLSGSVWAGTTPAAGGTGWVTLSFRAKGNSESGEAFNSINDLLVVQSFAHDSTTAVFNFTYDSETKTGALSAPGCIGTDGRNTPGVTTNWNMGSITVNDDKTSMTVSAHGGITLKRYR